MKKNKHKQKLKDDKVVVACAKCGHKHPFESLQILEHTPTATPCEKCGFLFLQYLASKMDATLTLLKSDSTAVALLRGGDIEGFEKYLEEKTGIRRITD